MTVAVNEQLHTFATTLLERRGALVEWPAADRAGTAMLPPEIAEAVHAGDEVVPLACGTGGEGLSVDLAGDFLEWADRLLDAVPRVGVFRVRDLYLKRKELDEAVARTFTWLNVKVKLRDAHETAIEYHTWWFHGTLSSEDHWETCFCVSLNAATGAEVEIPDPLGLWEIQPRPGARAESPATCERAGRLAQGRMLQRAAGFLDRMDARLQRDRKRLRDYYNALARESEKKGRGRTQPDPEKVEAAKRAVRLELHRKLAELDDRYAMSASLRPVALVRTEVPVLAVELSVYRKQSQRKHTVYWNPLLKQFDPLVCSGCGEGIFAAAFANDTVEPLCQMCIAAPSR